MSGRRRDEDPPSPPGGLPAGGTHAEIGRLVARNPAKRRSSSCTTGLLPRIDGDLPQHVSEGRLDMEFQIILSVAPHVRECREQPETFRWRSGGRAHRYTADAFAGTTLGRFYFEVKPARILARSPDLDGRLGDIRAQCAARGARFEIITEEHVRHGRLLPNSIAMWSAAQAADPAEVRRACDLLKGIGFPASLGAVEEALGRGGPRMARALIGLRLLAVDLNLRLRPTTVVHRGGKDWT